MEEVCEIARAQGIELPQSVIKKHLDDTAAMKPYRTSMLLDYEAGRSMEVEAILGNAVRLAKRFAVAAPNLNCLYGLMQVTEIARKMARG